MLKTVLSGLTTGQEITVNFRGNMTNLNGNYKVITSKKDRGKMGSFKTTVQSMTDTTSEIVLHTKKNEEVLNITVNGTMYGSATESGEPRSYKKDETRGRQFKELFQTFAKEDRVKMTSDVEPSFNGTFTVKDNQKSPGKWGQIVLTLTADGTTTFKVWSHRHSLVLNTIELAE